MTLTGIMADLLISNDNTIRTNASGALILANDGTAPSFTCELPATVTAIPGETSVQLSWTAVAGASSYDVRYKLATAGTYVEVTGVTGTSTTITGLVASSTYDIGVRTDCGSSESLWNAITFDTDDPPQTGDVWTDTITGATQVFQVDPTDWPVGDISSNDFINNFPNLNQHKTFIASPRIARTTAPNGLEALRFWDPVCRPGENRNPYYRRTTFYNNGLDDDNFSDAGLAAGADEIGIQFGMYFRGPHIFSGTDDDKNYWAMGKHSKWIFGVSGDNGFANTGGNVQPDGEFEVVWTHYSALISNEDAKGDFPHATISNTDFDYSGTYGPAYNKNDPNYVQNYGHMGLGVYSADPRHSYNYEEQIWPVYPGTNIRRPYTVGVYYEWRVVVKLDDSGQNNGEIYWWWREDGGAWELVAQVNNWRARGNTNIKIRRIGPLGMFNGGWGWGWSWGDTDEYPFTKSTAGGPQYDRGYYVTYFNAWGK